MITYSNDRDNAYFYNMKFVRDKKTGYYLSSHKVGNKRKRLHVAVWEHYNGEVPDGHSIHHVDQDKYNNEPENLLAMTKEEHSAWHGERLSEEQKEKLRKNLIEKAIPKANEWHRSPEGRAWHHQHSIDIAKNMQIKERQCDYCGKQYKYKREGLSQYCCSNCRCYARKKRIREGESGRIQYGNQEAP